MASSLWLPEYAGEILCVTVEGEADDFDFEGMLKINASAFDWLDGKLDTGTYFDILDHYGVDPIEFVEPVRELYLAGS
jgi:hypothetical protein